MSSLHQAALMGNMQILRMLIHSNASLDATDAKGDSNNKICPNKLHRKKLILSLGMSALHYATLHNTPEIASFLLQSGAKVDIINCDGNSALHMACQQGQIQVVHFVILYWSFNFQQNFTSLSSDFTITVLPCRSYYSKQTGIDSVRLRLRIR